MRRSSRRTDRGRIPAWVRDTVKWKLSIVKATAGCLFGLWVILEVILQMLLDFSYLKCLHCQLMALQGERGESQPLIPVSTSGNRGGQAEHWLGHKCGFRVFAGLGLLCNSHFSTQPVTVGVPWRSFQKPVVSLLCTAVLAGVSTPVASVTFPPNHSAVCTALSEPQTEYEGRPSPAWRTVGLVYP